MKSLITCSIRLLFIISIIEATNTEVYDLRIYEGAEKGTRLTMSSELQSKIEKMKNCFGQLETNVAWVEYRSSRNSFYTTDTVRSARNIPDNMGTLHLLCTGNRMHSLELRFIVSHRNHHAPTFSTEEYTFYIPMTSDKNNIIAQITVTDNDPVIYNSERRLSFTKEQPMFEIFSNGSIVLKSLLVHEVPYRPIRMQVLAIDFGSPQLYSLCNLTIVPVTVSAVQELSVNIATSDYQVLQWEPPAYGHPDKYRILIRRIAEIVYEDELDGLKTKALTKVPITSEGQFSYQIISIDASGQTPSDVQMFNVIHKDMHCEGDCDKGGRALCYYGNYDRVEQFVDDNGAHCLCYPGHYGISCQLVATCPPEKTISAYGGVDWIESPTNASKKLHCPYNMIDDSLYLERSCSWDNNFNRAIWTKIKGEDQCKTQRSVLTHLGVLGTFLGNANSVSTINTVARFIKDLMTVPAFSTDSDSYAHFDQKIAEDITRLLDILLALKIDLMQGNTTVAKWNMFTAVQELHRRLPVPMSLSSPEHSIELKTLHWTKFVDNMDNSLGTRCRINLPRIHDSRVLRASCMTNSTLFEVIELSNPILSISVDAKNGAPEFDFSTGKITILLKPSNKNENYTCVRYEEDENGWTAHGLRRTDNSYHGFIKCEITKLGVYSLLPERLFLPELDGIRDLSALLPTSTTIISIICSIFLLFMAAAQRNQTIDLALLVFLFFVFLLHITHLVMIVAPQVGDPFAITPALHLLLQFSILSIASSLYLVIASIRDVIINIIKSNHNMENNNLKEEIVEEKCCSRPCSVLFLCFILPAILTFTSYCFSDEMDQSFSRLLAVDWLFICNYLFPSVFFFAMGFAYAIWNVCIGTAARSRNRSSADRFYAVSPAIQSSALAIFQMTCLMAIIVLFIYRKQTPLIAFLFCGSQILYSLGSFVFGSFIFRVRFEFERETDGSYHSLERKRDISRALLEHVDTRHIADSTDTARSPEQNDLYIHMSQSLYDRQPMVSIV